MPSLSELPGEIRRDKFLKALKRLGFEISLSGGNGSHCKITWPKNGKSVTLPKKVIKQTLKYVLVEIESYTGIAWEDIKREF